MSDYKDSDGLDRRSGGTFKDPSLGSYADQYNAGVGGNDSRWTALEKINAANRQKDAYQPTDFRHGIKISPAVWLWICIGIVIWAVIALGGDVISRVASFLGLPSKFAPLILLLPVLAYEGYKLFIKKGNERSGRKILSAVLNMVTLLVLIALFIWSSEAAIAMWGGLSVLVANYLLQKIIKAK